MIQLNKEINFSEWFSFLLHFLYTKNTKVHF